MPRVAIIGAGISGLSCGRKLARAGFDVVVIEKSRSFGGRCATRLWDGAVVDHGAQFFTIQNAAFRKDLESLEPGRIRELPLPVLDEKGMPLASDGRWYHVGGNNRLAHALAEGLNVRFQTEIHAIRHSFGHWRVDGERFDLVVSCAPWPQTAKLLGRSTGAAIYSKCLAAFFAYAGNPSGLAKSAYAVSDRSTDVLRWTACENHKQHRIPKGRTVFVVHAARGFSAEFYDAAPEVWVGRLRGLLEARWGLDAAKFLGNFTHRWGYAQRIAEVAAPVLPRGFFLCGDSLVQSRIEDVWLSGVETAERVPG